MTRRQEVLRKYNDPRWRLNNLYYINDKQGQRVKFKENVFQRRLNNLPGRRKLILKPRQVGISTNELLKQFDATVFNANYNACILAHKREVLPVLFNIPSRAWKSMHPELQPQVDRGGGSRYEMRFPKKDSRIFVTLDAISQTIHWLHISEAAFIKQSSRIKDTMEAVPKDSGIITMETTANGMGNFFYDQWTENDDYLNVFFPWFLFPEYKMDASEVKYLTPEEKELCVKARQMFHVELSKEQIAFRRSKKHVHKSEFLKYYPEDDVSCFLTGSDQPIDLLVVSEMLEKRPEPIYEDENFIQFEKPHKDGRYVISADTSEGVGGDYSVACVYDARKRRKVAQIRSNKWRPGDFAAQIVKLAENYKSRAWPMVGVEMNNHGHAVLLALQDTHRYGHYYYASETNKKNKRPGWITDKVTRPLMLDTYIEGLENGTIEEPERNTLQELLTLVNNDGKIEAADGKHDDCVISSAIGIQLCLDLVPQITTGRLSEYIRV